NTLELRRVAQGAEVDARFQPISDSYAAREPSELVDQSGVDALMRVDALDSGTDLAAVFECSPEDPGSNRGRIHIVEHDGRIVAAQLQSEALEVRRSGLCNVLARRRRASERNLAD